MEACPFCGGEVSEQIVLYGGTCPHCFGDIPGEEAATDPGDDVKAALEAQDRKRASRRTVIPLAIAGVVALAVAGGALALLLQPEKELALLDLDEGEYYTPDLDSLVVAQADDPGKTDAEEAGDSKADPPSQAVTNASGPADDGGTDKRIAAAGSATGSPDAPKLKVPRLGGNDAAADADLLKDLGTPDAEDITRTVKRGGDLAPSSLSKDLELSAGMSSGGKISSGGMAMDMGAISQSSAPLSSPQRIAYMVRDVLKRQLPRLRPCYEGSLRANPGLRGSWVLTFTVETDGSVNGARAIGQDVSDGSLEECLVRRMSAWRFQRIVKPQPVKKTVDFTR